MSGACYISFTKISVAPEKVMISGHQHATAGDTITLKCTSAISNPPAVITWFSLGQQLNGATKSVKPSPDVSINYYTIYLELSVITKCAGYFGHVWQDFKVSSKCLL